MWSTLQCQSVSRDAVLYVRQYSLSWHIIYHIFSNKHVLLLFYFSSQINLTVVQYLNHYGASYTSRWLTLPSLLVGRDGVSYVRQYIFCWHIISHIFSNQLLLHLFYFTTSNKFNRITVSYQLWSIITVKVTYTAISACRPRCRRLCPAVYVRLTNNIFLIFKLASSSFVSFHRFY